MSEKIKDGFLVLAFIFILSIATAHITKTENVLSQVAVVKVYGAIGTEGSFMNPVQSANADEIKSLLKEAVDTPNVVAIVLDINSPGGSAGVTEGLVKYVKTVKRHKPVVAFIEDVGASGGYWVAAAANKIVIHKLALTGSIGVLSEFVDASGLLKRYNITIQTIKSGKYKDSGTIARNLTEEEQAMFQNISDIVYDEFVTSIAAERNMSIESVKSISQGQILLGVQAVDYGLVDMIGTKDDAIQLAAELGGAKEVETWELKPKKGFKEVINDVMNAFGYATGRGMASVLWSSHAALQA